MNRNEARGSRLERAMAGCFSLLRYTVYSVVLVLVAGVLVLDSDELFLGACLLTGCGNPPHKKADWIAIPYQPEDYTAFDGPRLQFISQHPKENHDSIWTIQLDGSDLRKTLAWEDLQAMQLEQGIYPPVIRSPDHRYIALTASSNLIIVDLLKKEKTLLGDGNRPFHAWSYQWTRDSKKVVFFKGGGMWEYTLATRELRPRKVFFHNDYALIDGDSKFFTQEKGGFALYTYAGDLIRSVDLNNSTRLWAVSGSGRLLAYHYEISYNGMPLPPTQMLEVLDTGRSKVVRTLENQYWVPFGFSKDETAVYLAGYYIAKYDLATGALHELFPVQRDDMIGLTLINDK